MKLTTTEIRLKGVPLCEGVAIGKAYIFNFAEDSIPEFSISPQDACDEIARFHLAMKRSKIDVLRLHNQLLEDDVWEGASILDAHLQLMDDPMIITQTEEEIKEQCKNAEFVFQRVIKDFQLKFQQLSDPFFRERFKDIHDVSRRVLSYLKESVHISMAEIPKGSIVFSKELIASAAAEAKKDHVLAFVTQFGGPTSHAAIVAKAKGIPFISSVFFDQVSFAEGDLVIVDGKKGELIIHPTEETLASYREIQDQVDSFFEKLNQMGHLAAETYDGYSVSLSANVETSEELSLLHQYGGSGVGLYRSEYLFLANDCFPSEEEQFVVYKEMVENMEGLPLVMRVFDLGGDKYVSGQRSPAEKNAFLGCRAIRFLLQEKDLFKTQLRAILRASAFGNVKLLFPMISNLNELRQAKQLIQEAQEELISQGISVGEGIPVGCMVEVPSAALITDLLAKECDFLSIGTNDLVQYSLAVDRSDHGMNDHYMPTHPSVIRLIRLIISEANHHGVPVSICGEIAADPKFTPLLLGLGVHELSVSLRYLPVIKQRIRQTSIVEACKLAERVLELGTPEEISDLLEEVSRCYLQT